MGEKNDNDGTTIPEGISVEEILISRYYKSSQEYITMGENEKSIEEMVLEIQPAIQVESRNQSAEKTEPDSNIDTLCHNFNTKYTKYSKLIENLEVVRRFAKRNEFSNVEFPNDEVDYLINKSSDYNVHKKYDLSLDILNILKIVKPFDWRVWNEMSLSNYEKGCNSKNYEEKKRLGVRAIQFFEITKELNPDNKYVLHGIGLVHLNIFKNPEHAEIVFKECTELYPDFSEWYYHDLGLARFQQGKYNEAIDAYCDALAKKEQMWTNYDIALCYSALGEPDNIERYRKRAVELGANEIQLNKSIVSHSFYFYRNDPKAREMSKEQKSNILTKISELLEIVSQKGNDTYSINHTLGDSYLHLSWVNNNNENYARKSKLKYLKAFKKNPKKYWTAQNLVSVFKVLRDEENASRYQQIANELKK